MGCDSGLVAFVIIVNLLLAVLMLLEYKRLRQNKENNDPPLEELIKEHVKYLTEHNETFKKAFDNENTRPASEIIAAVAFVKTLKKKMTTKELSLISKISYTQLLSIENFKSDPRLSTLVKIVDALGYKISIVSK